MNPFTFHFVSSPSDFRLNRFQNTLDKLVPGSLEAQRQCLRGGATQGGWPQAHVPAWRAPPNMTGVTNEPVDYAWFPGFPLRLLHCSKLSPVHCTSKCTSFLLLCYGVCVVLSHRPSLGCGSSQGCSSPCLIHPCLLSLQITALQQGLLHKWVMNEWLLHSIQWRTTRKTPIPNPERHHSLIRHLLYLAVIHGYALFWARERRPELPKCGYIKSSKKGHRQLSQWPRL